MTYDVPIEVKDVAKSWAIFAWCHDRGWRMEKDYLYVTPLYASEKWDYKFKFKCSEDATLFALRWS